MNKRMWVLILLGSAGFAVLCGLGIWQIQRLYEKRGQLDAIIAGISTPAVALPESPNPDTDRYRPVTAEGRFTNEQLYVLSGKAMIGAGVRVVSVLQTTDGRRILVDRGFLPDAEKHKTLTVTNVKISGNLMWPQDSNSYTPPPDTKTGLWFARDTAAMAALLNTEATLIVANAPTGDGIEAIGVDASTIPNDHQGYAITWFSLAFVWALMTVALAWRIRQRTV